MRATIQTHQLLFLMILALVASGCRGRQFAHVLKDTDKDVVGTHAAGAETFNPLVEEAVCSLLAKQWDTTLSEDAITQKIMQSRVCFVGIENRSSEDLGDFHDQLYQQVDTLLSDSPDVQLISGRYVDAGLLLARLKPEELFVPANMREFTAMMEQNGQPFDCLVFGTLTSGTTESNSDYQRDYLLTLEMVDVQSGAHFKESAKIRKGYHRTALGKMTKYNPFRR